MDGVKEAMVARAAPAVQVGALPIRIENGELQILLVTSRETRRWVIPKGWPMKGIKNWAAAAKEAKQEAGIVGRPHKKPIGDFLYFKRRASNFDLCRVEVYLLEFEKAVSDFREKGQRQRTWFAVDEAAARVDEPGLIALLRDLDIHALKTPKRRPSVNKKAGTKRAKRRPRPQAA